MTEGSKPGWTFLTNHAHVLMCLAAESDIRGRDVGDKVGITERAAQGIIGDLVAEGYVERVRIGRRNQYTVRMEAPLRHQLDEGHTVRDLLDSLGRLRP